MQQRSKEKELFRASGIWFNGTKPLVEKMQIATLISPSLTK